MTWVRAGKTPARVVRAIGVPGVSVAGIGRFVESSPVDPGRSQTTQCVPSAGPATRPPGKCARSGLRPQSWRRETVHGAGLLKTLEYGQTGGAV